VDLPEASRAQISVILSRALNARPIFIQAFWRSGSTYIWKKFREQPQYRAYYEPLNELLVKPREQILHARPPASAAQLRHPSIDQFYFAEFPFTDTRGVEFFEKPLSYQHYCLDEDAEAEPLNRYIGNLIAHASRRGQRAVLQFNRGLLRAGWLTRNFSPINILLVRRPVNVWKSILSFANHSFVGIFTLLLGQNRFKAPVKYLPEWVEIPLHAGETIEEDYAHYGPIAIENENRLYPSFFDFYLLSIVHCAQYADCILDMDEISRNAGVRKATTDRLRELGISISLDDCELPRYGIASSVEREWLAYENFARTYLKRTLPPNLSVPGERFTANYFLLGNYFRALVSEFTARASSRASVPSDVVASNAAAKHAEGIRLFRNQRFEEAARILGHALAEAPTSERWNDWSTAQIGCSRSLLAELGYQQALRMAPENSEAAGNLGALLASLGRNAEAVALLEQAQGSASIEVRRFLSQRVADLRESVRLDTPPSLCSIAQSSGR
jgi:tetratricopeptide (TPR) repeat protein